MPRLVSTFALRSMVLLSLISLGLNPAHAANRVARTPGQSAPSFQSWMSGVLPSQPSFAPSSPDNWLGGAGNWSNGADWSAGEPGSGSDVFIDTGNDSVTLDVSASIDSLTLGGASGTSTLMDTDLVTLTIAGALTINQSGTLTFYDPGGISAGGNVMNAGNMTFFHGGLTAPNIINSGRISLDVGNVNASGTLTNSGTIAAQDDVNGVGAATIVNSGTIFIDSIASTGDLINQSGGVVSARGLNVGGNLINEGSIKGYLERASRFSVAGELTNGGTIDVEYGSSFSVATASNTGTVMTGAQSGSNSISISGTLTNEVGGVFAIDGMNDVATIGYVNNAGSISIANGSTLQIVSSHAPTTALPGFLNSGTVLIASDGTVSSPLTYSQTAGQTTIDGTLRVSGHSNVLFSGGAVYGNGGTIEGNTISNAAFNMGDMPNTIGMMAITGNYTQGANGSIAFDIASLTSFDQLNITGRASLNGTLFVDLLNGYVPQIGNLFDIMNFSSSSGTFSTTVGLPINNQEHFVLEYNSTNLTLDVVAGPDDQPQSGHGSSYYEPYVSEITDGADQLDNFSSPGATAPEPGSLVLLASGLLGIAGVGRKRI